MITRLHDDDGSSLIAAMLIAAVVLSLSALAMGLATHNMARSGEDRQRVQAAAAAEAGINHFYSHLQSADLATAACTLTGTVDTAVGSNFTVTAIYRDTNGVAIDCDPSGGLAQAPAQVELRSEGKAIGDRPVRVIESLVNIRLIESDPFGHQAIVSDRNPFIGANAQVFGDGDLDGDLYINDNCCSSQGANITIYGSIYAQGAIDLDQVRVKGDIYATGPITLTQSDIEGHATSSTGSIHVGQGSEVMKNATAAGAITPETPDRVGGDRFPNTAGIPGPPARPFPDFEYVEKHWTDDGYNPVTPASCTAAKTAIDNITTGKWVIVINDTCDLNYGGTLTMHGDLAIITAGSITFSHGGQNRIASADDVSRDLFLFAGVGTTWPCTGDVTFTQGSGGIASPISSFIHSPCTVSLANPGTRNGQIFGGTVNFTPGQTPFTFRPMTVPGTGIQGFHQLPVYTREVPAS